MRLQDHTPPGLGIVEDLEQQVLVPISRMMLETLGVQL